MRGSVAMGRPQTNRANVYLFIFCHATSQPLSNGSDVAARLSNKIVVRKFIRPTAAIKTEVNIKRTLGTKEVCVFVDVGATMPFLGQDWRSPGEQWVRTTEGWERLRMWRLKLLENFNESRIAR